jgi:hypothetical protein
MPLILMEQRTHPSDIQTVLILIRRTPMSDVRELVESAIVKTVEEQFEGMPPQIRPCHYAKILGVDVATLWRRRKAGRLEWPCQDHRGPWMPREQAKQDLLKQLRADMV